MMAELFLTFRAADTAVSIGGKSFGVQLIGYLPTEKKSERKGKHCQGEHVGDKHQRREHHGKIPIIYAAVGTAAILHKPRLEGAEEQNAYHIANAVSKADQHQRALVNNTKQVKPTHNAVQRHPYGNYRKCPFPRHESGLLLARWQKATLKYLLTA